MRSDVGAALARRYERDLGIAARASPSPSQRCSSASKSGASDQRFEPALSAAQVRGTIAAAHRFGQLARIARGRRRVDRTLRASRRSRGHTRSRKSSSKTRCTVASGTPSLPISLTSDGTRCAQMLEQRVQLLAPEQLARMRRAPLRPNASRRSRSDRKRARRQLRLRSRAVGRDPHGGHTVDRFARPLARRRARRSLSSATASTASSRRRPSPASASRTRMRVACRDRASDRRAGEPGITMPISLASARRTSPMRSSSCSASGGASSATEFAPEVD